MPREELEDIDGIGADEGEEWELVAEREWHDSVQRRPQALLTGEWSTPSVDKASLAPGCRIQRRTPVRNFQAHCHFLWPIILKMLHVGCKRFSDDGGHAASSCGADLAGI